MLVYSGTGSIMGASRKRFEMRPIFCMSSGRRSDSHIFTPKIKKKISFQEKNQIVTGRKRDKAQGYAHGWA